MKFKIHERKQFPTGLIFSQYEPKVGENKAKNVILGVDFGAMTIGIKSLGYSKNLLMV